MDNKQDVNDQIERYMYQVSRFLTGKNKEDIEKEIRSLIDDMLEEKCQGREPGMEDIKSVFASLGKPGDLAAKYNDSKRYLIGPALFPFYRQALAVILAISLFGVLISNLVSAFQGTFAWEDLGNIISTAVSVFAFVTIGFALIEWRGVKIDELPDITAELPPVPKKKERIPISEPIVGLIFSFIFICLFVITPEIFGFWNAGTKEFIPFLNMDTVRSIMGLFVLSFTFPIIKDVFQLLEGRYSVKLMIVTILCNAASLAMAYYLIRNFQIFNSDFPNRLSVVLGQPDIAILKENVNTVFGSIFLAIMTFAMGIDTFVCMIKTLVYGRNR